MHIALTGALVGTAAATALFIVDYLSVRKRAAERAKRMNRPVELDSTERMQIRGVIPLCLCIPPAFAGLFWLVGGLL